MRTRDPAHITLAIVAVIFDSLAAFGGFMLSTWIRFDSGWIPMRFGTPPRLYAVYALFGAVVTAVILLVLRHQGLFIRPQTGTFINKIPRLVKAGVLGTLISIVVAFPLKHDFADISRVVIALSCPVITALVLLERWILFRIEWNLARHSHRRHHVLILGTDFVAARLKRTFSHEHMLRAQVVGFLRTTDAPDDPGVPPAEILGSLDDLHDLAARQPIDQVILTGSLGTDRMLDLLLFCEQRLITFNLVPDLFHLMTTSMDVQSLDDIPLLGVATWPLDRFWNRALKRIEDVAGALVGLLLSAPLIAVAAVVIRITSPGPVFYRQERCGEKGRCFTLYKLRTMRPDAETDSGPVFTAPDDPRRTPFGAFLRHHNIDELPQFWNVLKGEMSLVGPRPERPYFVEQFKAEIARYMWRHVSKPGVTGWAQVNGLRGDTSIAERVKYDLYYLENWSLALDFKILLKTLFARENAY